MCTGPKGGLEQPRAAEVPGLGEIAGGVGEKQRKAEEEIAVEARLQVSEASHVELSSQLARTKTQLEASERKNKELRGQLLVVTEARLQKIEQGTEALAAKVMAA